MSDRDWIVNTLLDVGSTEGEVEAAARAATPTELKHARRALDEEAWWNDLRIRDLRGQLVHLADQGGCER